MVQRVVRAAICGESGRVKIVKGTWWFLLAAVLLVGGYVGTRQPWLFVSAVNAPGVDRTVGLHSNLRVGQRVRVPRRTLSGVAFYVAPDTPSELNTPLVLHVRRAGAEQDTRTVYQETSRVQLQSSMVTSALRTKTIPESPLLVFRFEPVAVGQEGVFDLILEAPELSRQEEIDLAFQIDDTKYPGGSALYNGEIRERDLGFWLYEQPTIGEIAARWLLDPARRASLVGGVLILIGSGSYIFSRTRRWHVWSPVSEWHGRWQRISWRTTGGVSLVLVVMTLVVFWPATEMSFIQDDIQKLLRVREMRSDLARLVFTVERYQSPGNEILTPVAFWRPMSFSLYPLALYTLFGLWAWPYYLASLLILTALAVGILVLSQLLITRNIWLAVVATAIFLLHSSKTAAVYWWSSTEDTLASLFIVLTILAYCRWRAVVRWRWLVITTVLMVAALLSKEHGLMVLPLIVLVELVVVEKLNVAVLRKLVVGLWPLVVVAGIYLLARDLALTWPLAETAAQADESYNMVASLKVVGVNIIPYAAWTVENRLWPRLADPAWLEYTQPDLAEHKPLYPGVLLLALYGMFLAYSWRTRIRKAVLFVGAWWLLSLGPVLFINEIWNKRWLTLAVAGWGWLVVLIVKRWIPAGRQWVVGGLLLVVLAPAGFSMARSSRELAPFYDILQGSRSVVADVEQSSRRMTPDSIVYLIDVPHEHKGTVNAYLLRLYLPDVNFHQVQYLEQAPVEVEARDVMVFYKSTRSPDY